MKLHLVEIGGKKMPFYFGIDAVDEIRKNQEVPNAGNLMGQMKRAFSIGLRHGHEKQGVKFDLIPPKITALIDENPKKLGEVWRLYNADATAFFEALNVDNAKK